MIPMYHPVATLRNLELKDVVKNERASYIVFATSSATTLPSLIQLGKNVVFRSNALLHVSQYAISIDTLFREELFR
jgi:hypothetical protein